MKRTMTFMAITAAMALLMASCNKASDEMEEEKEKQEQQGQGKEYYRWNPGGESPLLHLDEVLWDFAAEKEKLLSWYSERGYENLNYSMPGSEVVMYFSKGDRNVTQTFCGEEIKGAQITLGLSTKDKNDVLISEIEGFFKCKLMKEEWGEAYDCTLENDGTTYFLLVEGANSAAGVHRWIISVGVI